MNNISRRNFLRASLAASAAPWFVPATAFGANRRINLGFIGIGKMGEGHLRNITRTWRKEVQVVAVCDVYEKFRDLGVQIVNETYGQPGCAGFNDFTELITRNDIDAVLIATPDHWHAIPSIQAMREGKHVYCEKPLSLTIDEAWQMVGAARRYGRVFQTGSQQRSGYSGRFRRACELVRNGYIGDIKEVWAGIGGPSEPCDLPPEPTPEGLDWERWLGPAPYRPFHSILRPPHNDTFPRWRNYIDYSGGSMTDWGAHHFDIAQWGLGKDGSGPVSVTPPDEKDVEHLTYIYDNGIPLYRGMRPDAPGGTGVFFVGTEGWVAVNRGMMATHPASLLYQPVSPSDIHLYDSKSHHGDFFSCVRTGQRPICDVETGASSVTVCHLGNIAYWLDRPLRWDPRRHEFLDDDDANGMRSRAKREPWIV